MQSFVLAVDIGTSGVKLLLLDIVDGRSFSVTKQCAVRTGLGAEQNPADWWAAVCGGMPELLRLAGCDARDITAVGVDGMSWTPVMLDARGRILANAPLWYDRRATRQCEQIRKLVGEDAVFAVSGNPVQPYYTLPKVMWYRKHHAEALRGLRHVLSSNGYIVWKLTGEWTQDETQAYGWPFFDMEHGTWNEAMAETLGIDLDWLPPLCESRHIAGAVTGQASRESGLLAGVPVIAGGLDAACGALGAGVFAAGPVHEQSGSAGGMSICTQKYRPAPGLIISRHVVPGRWLVQGGTVGGGGVMRWLTQTLYPANSLETEARRRDELIRDAVIVPAGSDGLLFLPYMAGERSPVWSPEAKGLYWGIDYQKTRGHLVRAALEGAAFALRHNIETAMEAGISMEEMRAVGGAAGNPLWMQIKADVTGIPIRAVGAKDATAVGCAILTGAGAGIWSGFETACQRFVRLEPPYTPNRDNRPMYDNLYNQYLRLSRRTTTNEWMV